jgi:glucose-1-phosphate thymidylyltransferase
MTDISLKTARPMKAVILAGGNGSRLYPLTQVASKQLQPVYDKPMIYYPLTVLIAAGIKEYCLITSPTERHRFEQLLGYGAQWGINIEYREQPTPAGIAQALIIAADFIGSDNVALMLGDNIFSGGGDIPKALAGFSGGATIFAYHVRNPSDYGVVEFDRHGAALSLEEKPTQPRSAFAIPGLYIYDCDAVEIATSLSLSQRGELEITDVNREYLRRDKLVVHRLARGFAWLDAGTSSSLQEASSYIEAIERRQGIKVGCPEEAALVRGFLSLTEFEKLLCSMPACEYREYLQAVAAEYRQMWDSA